MLGVREPCPLSKLNLFAFLLKQFLSIPHQTWTQCLLAYYLGQVRLQARSFKTLRSYDSLIGENRRNVLCPLSY